MNNFDSEMIYLLKALFCLLSASSLICWILRKKFTDQKHLATLSNLNSRIKSWWIMSVIFVLALLTGGIGSIILFALTSFVALREYISLTPTRKADHRTLFWMFFIILPIQYLLIAIEWYGLFAIFIPVYVFIFIPFRAVIAGDYENFLERTAKIQWGLMVCVYFVSHVVALLTLDLANYAAENAKLLFYFVLVVQLNDVFQYVWGKSFGKTKLAPTISPNKTIEGAIGGILTATLIGTLLYAITPFGIAAAAILSLIISVMGIVGDLTMSAIKRDIGVKDFSTLIEGHGGMLDRIDSICFAAPVFFHLSRYFFS